MIQFMIRHAFNCRTPALRGLQCTATPGPRFARVTRRRMPTTRGPRYCGLPESDRLHSLPHTDPFGLQCVATPGPRIIRATRRQVQLHPDHAAAGYPEAESPDHTPLSTPASRPEAGAKEAGYPTTAPHTRTTLIAGYPEVGTDGPADARRHQRGYPHAVCDSCTQCRTPTLKGSSVRPHPDHAYAGYPEADAGPPGPRLAGYPGETVCDSGIKCNRAATMYNNTPELDPHVTLTASSWPRVIDAVPAYTNTPQPGPVYPGPDIQRTDPFVLDC